jgi:hypothetical protein
VPEAKGNSRMLAVRRLTIDYWPIAMVSPSQMCDVARVESDSLQVNKIDIEGWLRGSIRIAALEIANLDHLALVAALVDEVGLVELTDDQWVRIG